VSAPVPPAASSASNRAAATTETPTPGVAPRRPIRSVYVVAVLDRAGRELDDGAMRAAEAVGRSFRTETRTTSASTTAGTTAGTVTRSSTEAETPVERPRETLQRRDEGDVAPAATRRPTFRDGQVLAAPQPGRFVLAGHGGGVPPVVHRPPPVYGPPTG